MNEKDRRKREWVKTAAIVFLAAMLVLTFFSSTIQNWSLPEVATQYVQSGTITAKIRGTGSVESTDPYEVKVTETRKVASVAVLKGATVQKGDVLVYLEGKDSEELAKAKEELEAAQNAYDKALLSDKLTASDIWAATHGTTANSYRTRITAAQNEVTAAKNSAKQAETEVNDIQRQINDHEAQVTYEEGTLKVIQTKLAEVQSVLDAKDEMETAQTEYTKYTTVSPGDAAGQKVLQNAYLEKQENYNKLSSRYPEAESTYKELTERQAECQQVILNMNERLVALNVNLYNAKKAKDEADANVKAKEEALTELLATVNNVTGLEKYLDDIAKAQAKVDELTANAGGTTITAPISGTVSEINVKAGNETSAAVPVVVMQPEGRGYTLSFSVTNDQARRVSVGDVAELVNAWRYDNVIVTLANIKPDPNNPGQNKLLTFNVTGDVAAGQTLNLSVGQKSSNYDFIVPNSAVREDNNGKFILIVKSKSSPLGTRYTAERVDVQVIASDETQSAVSGALQGYEFVITTSNKPVEAGDLVRLPD